MAQSSNLSQRIQAEFNARAERQKATADAQTREAQSREAGLAAFGKLCDELKEVWRPSLEEFIKQFGEKVKVAPAVTASMREVKVHFLTDMATVTLTLAASPTEDLKKLVLDYDLFIVPIFFQYERHARPEVPMDKIDKAAIKSWVDDRLVACVKAYVSMQETRQYIERAMVEDPMSKARFMREDAKAKLEHNGKLVYFASEASLAEYRRMHMLDEPPQAEKSVEIKPATPAAVTGPVVADPAVAKPPAAAAKPG